ncbi:Uncharacterized protein dnm_070280 [Desulfonema magnum]|uniref:Uncharacterized protein n=1 Tax=Desulfonema magnum TaxID=45655 RepID=A0A975BSF3_9BACT|nr:Uncharacterized protein dnm_070280 [Desulfonema magnum]
MPKHHAKNPFRSLRDREEFVYIVSQIFPCVKGSALVQFNGIFRKNRLKPSENTANFRKTGDVVNSLILQGFPLN